MGKSHITLKDALDLTSISLTPDELMLGIYLIFHWKNRRWNFIWQCTRATCAFSSFIFRKQFQKYQKIENSRWNFICHFARAGYAFDSIIFCKQFQKYPQNTE